MRRLFARFHLLTENMAVRITEVRVICGADVGGRIGVGPWPRAGIEQGISAT